MSEKQIDLDAMRALAKEKPDTSGGVFSLSPQIILLQRALRATAAEIEQLRKSEAENLEDYNETLKIRRLEVEHLRKEQDALLAFIQNETDACTNSHLGGPCGQCTARRAALAAQGAKPDA